MKISFFVGPHKLENKCKMTINEANKVFMLHDCILNVGFLLSFILALIHGALQILPIIYLW